MLHALFPNHHSNKHCNKKCKVFTTLNQIDKRQNKNWQLSHIISDLVIATLVCIYSSPLCQYNQYNCPVVSVRPTICQYGDDVFTLPKISAVNNQVGKPVIGVASYNSSRDVITYIESSGNDPEILDPVAINKTVRVFSLNKSFIFKF